MSSEQSYDHDVNAYGEDNSFNRTKRASVSARRRPVQGRGRGKSPTSVNGLHKRRRRKIAW